MGRNGERTIKGESDYRLNCEGCSDCIFSCVRCFGSGCCQKECDSVYNKAKVNIFLLILFHFL